MLLFLLISGEMRLLTELLKKLITKKKTFSKRKVLGEVRENVWQLLVLNQRDLHICIYSLRWGTQTEEVLTSSDDWVLISLSALHLSNAWAPLDAIVCLCHSTAQEEKSDFLIPFWRWKLCINNELDVTEGLCILLPSWSCRIVFTI